MLRGCLKMLNSGIFGQFMVGIFVRRFSFKANIDVSVNSGLGIPCKDGQKRAFQLMAEALPYLVDNYTLFQLKGAPNEGQEM